MGDRTFAHPSHARAYAHTVGIPATEIKRWFREPDGTLTLHKV